jgi:methylase of polypeptide subunit release factors
MLAIRGTDADGLGLVKELAEQARQVLMPGGRLVLQVSGWQWPDLRKALDSLGYDTDTAELEWENAAVFASVSLAAAGPCR